MDKRQTDRQKEKKDKKNKTKNLLDAIYILFQDVEIKLGLPGLPWVFNVHSMLIQCLFNVYSMSILCLFNAHSICIQCTFNVQLICIQYTFNCFIFLIWLNGYRPTDSHTPNLEMLSHLKKR